MLHPEPSHDAHIGHSVPLWFIAVICAILLVLTGVTVWVAQLDFAAVHIPELNIIIAMAVAVVKATLVGLYFMHLRWDRPVVGFVFVASILLVTLFCGFTILDSFEYQDEVIPGDTPQIQQALDAALADDQ